VELREMRYLVVIGRLGNLGRAARELHVSQPALSAMLQKVEGQLRVRLFDRYPGGVRPTAAGRDVLQAAERTLAEADRVLVVAEAHAAGATGVLRVGFEATGAAELTTRSRAEFARRRPGVVIEPKRYDWGGEVAALRDGLVDVAFLWLPADTTGMEVAVVHEEPRVVGVHRGHRLAGRPSISIVELRDDPLMWTEQAPRPWVDWWAVNPRPDGSPPKWGPTNDNVEEMLEQVAEGRGVCLAPTSMRSYYGRPDVRWVPVTDIEPLRVAIARMRHRADPLALEFTALVQELSGRPPAS
jgi:DNA-binding transcriptional LysR family regulator